jgi:hypothetical protein
MAATMLGSLLVSLGLDSAQFHSGLNKADKRVKTSGDRMEALGRKVGTATKAMIGMGTAIAGSQLVGQLKDMALAGLEHASSLGEQAQQLGVTTSELQRYRYIATQVGIDQAVMDKGLAKLSVTLGDLAHGAAAPTKALQQLGLSQEQITRISQMSAGQAIPELAEAFSKLKNPTEAAAIAADLFGAKMGGKFLTLLMGGKQGIDALTESYKKLGIEITEGQIAKADEAADKLAAIQQVTAARQAQIASDNAEGLIAGLAAWEEFKVGLLSVFGQIIEGNKNLQAEIDRIADAIPDPITEIGKAIDWLDDTYAKARQGIIDSVRGIGQSLSQLASAGVQAAAKLYQGIKTWMIDKLNAAWAMVKREITEVKKAFFDLWDKVTRRSYIPDMVDDIAAQMKRLDTVMVGQAKKSTKQTGDAFKALAERVKPLLDELFPEAARKIRFEAESADLSAAVKAGQLDPAQGAEAQRRLMLARFPEIEAAAERIGATVSAVFDGLGTMSRDTFDEMTNAGKSAFEALREATFRYGITARDVFMTVTDNIKGAILGAQSLGEALRNIMAQLASKALDALFNTLGASIGIPGFANGTMSAPRGLALVGEQGPELVRFRGGEQVIPNHELSGMGGRQEVHKPTFVFPGITNDRMAREAAGQAARRYRSELNGPMRGI